MIISHLTIMFLTKYLTKHLFVIASCIYLLPEVEGNNIIMKSAFPLIPQQSFGQRTIENYNKHIIVVGSANADTFLSVLRLPVEGENLTTLCEPSADMPGGKGCTQAAAAAKLLLNTTTSKGDAASNLTRSVTFIGQFGSDNAAIAIRSVLQDLGVNIDHSGQHATLSSGRGYVFTAQASGAVSAVVSGGANIMGWKKYEALWDHYVASNRDPRVLQLSDLNLESIFSEQTGRSASPSNIVVMLQREIPEKVNLLVATYCRCLLKKFGLVNIVLDGGGEDRSISSQMLELCDYVMPNEIELRRLVTSFVKSSSLYDDILSSSAPLSNEDVVTLAKVLLQNGARNVIVTRGKYGSTFVSKSLASLEQEQENMSSIIQLHQSACVVQNVVDETGAGDCYRAGFVVATLLLEPEQHADTINRLQQCMAFASAAGAVAVTRQGAVPAAPTLGEVMTQLEKKLPVERIVAQNDSLRGGSSTIRNDDFPYRIGSRLNSMKDRSELWASPLNTPKDYIHRQTHIRGLSCVDFNYPQHFHFWTTADAKAALDEAKLVAGAVCLRFEAAKFARGAMNHPDADRRREAIQLTMGAAQTALDLGCNEVIVWSAFDGYDYPFQVDYNTKWQELVDAFQECCDAFPNVKFSLEYKPTDENTRFFTVPSTGAALLMVQEVNRPNFGLTLDVGHMLMSGENPGQSIAMVGRAGKLFGIQLNDGYTRLAAEDGLMFGSVHPRMALEIMYQLQKTNFTGHIYFDTFPQRSDPIKEAEYNIRRVKTFWKAAQAILRSDALTSVMQKHDAVRALELVDLALSTAEINMHDLGGVHSLNLSF
jgi:sugar/nucleoside kinase (ribokinase family)/sugar phosphate isomerase/epimerase